MSTPSLLNIPYLYKAGTLYSQIPESGAGDFTVSRTTTVANRSTRINKDGFIETVLDNVPRLDYPLGGAVNGCPALLVEPSAQNLALQSENFGTTWSPNQLIAFGSGSVLNTTGTLDPYGTNVSDLIVASTVSGVQHRIDQTTTSASGSYTFSVFVKAAGYNFTWLRIGTVGAFFNLSNGAITGTSAGIVASSQNYGNGWYRCIISKASSSANEVLRINIIQTDGVTDFAGDGTSGIYVFGAQYEAGSVATSYIPTTTAAVTRSADVISRTSASALIGQSEGTIYAEVDLRNKGVSVSRVIYLSDGTSNNEIRISHSVTTAGDLQIAIRLAGSLVVNQISPTAVYFGINKIAVGYKVGTNEVAMYVNGSQIILSTSSGNMPACNTIHLGSQLGTSNFLNDRIRAFEIYPNRIPNTAAPGVLSLATLTAP